MSQANTPPLLLTTLPNHRRSVQRPRNENFLATIHPANPTNANSKLTMASTENAKADGNKMTDEEWYAKYYALSDEINQAQRAANERFVAWMANPQEHWPAPAHVDELQEALTEHMYLAPDDEPDDPVEVMQRGEGFAQAHRDDMGAVQGYTHPWRHTQTRQYFDSLGEGQSGFLLDDKGGKKNPMPSTSEPILPRGDTRRSPADLNVARGRSKMALLLAVYGLANPEVDMTATEADRDRLLGRVTEDDNETIVMGSDNETIVMDSENETIMVESDDETIVVDSESEPMEGVTTEKSHDK